MIKKYILLLLVIATSFMFYTCGKKTNEEVKAPGEDVATSPDKDAQIQQYNLGVKEAQAGNRNPCDTLSLIAYVLANYPQGSYLVNFDKTLTFNIPKPAVIYSEQSDGTYIFALIARSKPGERLIEPKNIVGYDESFIDLDSTRLGTAFFYLTLFKCDNGTFAKIWESPVPDDGGFNNMTMERWSFNGTPFVKIDFHYARGVGHIDYNYFLINGLTQLPHLLMTYKGIDFQRTIANVNNDKYPDYYEYLYYNYSDRVLVKDSIAFIWDVKDSVYVNTRNHRQTRPY
ncbi:MAG: hypothetical protein WCA84_19860 [Ignavibacteriaceae bacterium]